MQNGKGIGYIKKKYKNGGKGVKNLQFGAKECFEYPCFSNKVASVVVTGVYRHIHIPFISKNEPMNGWTNADPKCQNELL